MNAALALLTGNETEADMERIQAAMLAWLTDDATGPPLHQRLGLSRRSARCELRNTHLRAAAALLAGDPWPRAEQLAESCRAFEARRWPRWRLNGPPPGAALIDLELGQARQFGEITLTQRQLFNIIATEANTCRDFGTDGR